MMEAATLRTSTTVERRTGASPFLRLQSDERLVTMTRRGNQAAFEMIVSRYQSRLLGFCRHMLSNQQDAEDVLQEVFSSAYTAMLADEREIMVRPWLYRIARNRSLNHIRRAKSIGVDSMDIHMSEHGLSTADRAHRNSEFRDLFEDITMLPETQRTALILREFDGLNYEQIADAMETTVPSVKSLLVRARVALAEMSEARGLTCDEVRIELGEVAEGVTRRITPPVRRHLKSCERCKEFKAELTATDAQLAAFAPIGVLFALKNTILSHLGLGSTGSTAAGASSAAAGSTAVGSSAASSVVGSLSAGAGAIATKAAAGLAAAAIVTAGASQVTATISHSATAQPEAAAQVAPAKASVAKPELVAAVAAPVAAATDLAAAPAAAAQSPVDAPAATDPTAVVATPDATVATPSDAGSGSDSIQQGDSTVTLPDTTVPADSSAGSTVTDASGSNSGAAPDTTTDPSAPVADPAATPGT
jgi:RNA polymerase sigma factor (sigma-70 family)